MQKPGYLITCLSLAVALGLSAGAKAQEAPPVDLYKVMAEANKASGWVAFRNYDGKQWVYFTPLVTLHCRVTEIRYSINSTALDSTFPLPKCNPAQPFSTPADAGVEGIAITLPDGTAQSVSVQILFEDDTESEMLTFAPCADVGDSSCATLVDG